MTTLKSFGDASLFLIALTASLGLEFVIDMIMSNMIPGYHDRGFKANFLSLVFEFQIFPGSRGIFPL